MSEEMLDDEDWTDLEKPSASGAVKPDVTVRLSERPGRYPSKTPRVRASIVLRRAAAAWIGRNGPRFRIQFGGPAGNLLRIVPDGRAGQFEAHELRGVKRLLLGFVSLWPNELRDETEASWRETRGGLVLELPEDFAREGRGLTPKGPPAAIESAAPPQAATKPPPVFPINTTARGLERQAKAIQQRNHTPALMGDPPPGRSALAHRLSGAKSE